jgi:2,4-dienoyl-CoA reductase-like NADH-dependent reductase (Old Yellow Enzyme family)
MPDATHPATPLLFQPLSLRGLQLANRIVVSPMCQYSANDGHVSDWHLMHVGNLALSGAGLLIMEMTSIEARGRISPHCLGLWQDSQVEALKPVLDFCRRHSDVALAVQIAHAGRKASCAPPWQGGGQLTTEQGGWQAVAPSAVSFADDQIPPRALGRDEIKQLIDDFAAATRRAGMAGYDAIELHGAHGYLLHQFLSPLSNRREDEYGGDLDNRMRLVLEVFDACRAEWPASKPLGIRLSATDWLPGGWDLDQTLKLAQKLVERGCDWIDVSSAGLSPKADIQVGPGYQVPFAEAVRQTTGITTMAVGLITGAQQAEQILQNGQADLVALARGLLYNPRWPWHAAAELGVELPYPNQYQRCNPRVVTPR